MVNDNQAMFGKLVLWQVGVLIAFSLLCVFFALKKSGEVLSLMTLIFSAICAFKYRALALSILIVVGPLLGILATGFQQVVIYLPFLLFSFLELFSVKTKSKGSVLLYIVCLILVLISFMLGYNPDAVMFSLQILSMSVFFVVWKVFEKRDVPIVVMGYLLSAIIAIIYMMTRGNDAIMVAGRLALDENAKTIGFICAVPFVFFLYSFIGKVYLFSNLKNKVVKLFDVSFMTLLLLTILMTLSRGLLMSIGLGIVLLMLLLKKKTAFFFAFVVCVILACSFSYVESMDLFRTERLFAYDELETGNGRTEIWLHYINKISNMGFNYMLIGSGPGNIERISNIGYYAHSTILDYYFSYGLIGFLTFLFVEFMVLKSLFKCDNKISFVIVVTFLLAYSTHGGAVNLTLFLVQALLYVNAKPQKLTIKRHENICVAKLV